MRAIQRLWAALAALSLILAPVSAAHAQALDFGARGIAFRALARTRERLTAPRTYWVRTDSFGNDANACLTGAAACATVQHAIDLIWNTLDTNGQTVTIQLVGTLSYNQYVVISGPVTGGGQIILQGNVSAPSQVPLTSTNADAILVQNGARVFVHGIKVSTTGTKGNGIRATNGGQVFYGQMEFGAVVDAQIDVDYGGVAIADGNYTISAGATSHFHSESLGVIEASNRTITLTNTPAFSAYFAGTSFGFIQLLNTVFSGAATGPRFTSHYIGAIRTSSGTNLSYLPGSSDGAIDSGGVVDKYGEAVELRQNFLAQAANFSGFYVPTYHKLRDIVVFNNNANAVTINIGTTAGGSDVVSGFVVAGNGFLSLADAGAIAKRLMNASANTTLYVSSTNWNGASVNFTFIYERLA